ncbi:MAG: hypothetical protein EHM41_24080, partial [Chloroflexi bacterium]
MQKLGLAHKTPEPAQFHQAPDLIFLHPNQDQLRLAPACIDGLRPAGQGRQCCDRPDLIQADHSAPRMDNTPITQRKAYVTPVAVIALQLTETIEEDVAAERRAGGRIGAGAGQVIVRRFSGGPAL